MINLLVLLIFIDNGTFNVFVTINKSISRLQKDLITNIINSCEKIKNYKYSKHIKVNEN